MPTAPTPALKDVIEAVVRADAHIHILGPAPSLQPDRAHPPLYAPDQHAYFELAICFAGEMSFVGHATTIRLRKGDAVLVKPGAWHYESYCRKSQPYRVCWVVATPRLMNCLFTHYHRGSFVASAYAGSPQLDEIAALETIAREASGHSLHGKIKAHALLLGLLIDLDRRLQGDALASPANEFDPVRKLLRIVQARFREPLQIRLLAKEVGLSADHLSRRFHETSGSTFKDYLNAIRIHHAKRLLESGWSVKRTADECGFDDVYYFGRVFKQRCQIPPGQFAKIPRTAP
jgi:AraC-like DNA-binding protein